MAKTMKKRLSALIYLVALMSVIGVVLAASFNFNPSPPLRFDISEDVYWTYDVNVSVDESLVNFSLEDNPYSSLTIDPDSGLMEFTPTNDEVGWNGEYYLIIVKNSSNPQTDIIITSTSFNVSNVNDAPNITKWQPVNITVDTKENITGGAFFNVNITDVDLKYGDKLNISWLLDGVPKKNQTDVTTTGNCTYVCSNWTFYPGFADAGVRNVTIIVNDLEFAVDSFEWIVNVNDSNRPPVFNETINNKTWSEGFNRTNNFSLHDKFYDLDFIEGTNNLTFGYMVHSVTGAWNTSMNLTITINQTTGNVSFITPHYDWFGVEVVQFYANDSYDIRYSNNVVLNVTNVNDPPVLLCPDNQTLAIEVPFSLDVDAYDIDSTNLSFSDNSPLFNITIDTGIISFTPNSTDTGVYDVNISVNDSQLFDWCIVEFNIIDNELPIIDNISNQTAAEGTFFELNVTARDPDVGDNLTFSDNTTMFDIYTINNSGINATGLINFTPTNDDVGNQSVLITATDSKGASSSTIFYIEINNINNVPYFTSIPTQDVRVNFTHVLDVRNYTIDLDNDVLNFTSNSSIFNITLEGIINVTLNSSYIGSYDINISVGDEGFPTGVNSTKIRFDVSINIPPRINQTIGTYGREDILFTYDLLATDPNGDTLTFTDDTDMFNIGSNGVIQFLPDDADVGNHTININVTDPYGAFNSTILYLEIRGENDAPVFIELENQTLQEEVSYTIYIVAYDVENDPLTFGSNTTMFNIIQHNSTAGRIEFTPDDADVGNHTIRFSVSDGFNITYGIAHYEISGTNDAPNITSFTPAANYTFPEGLSELFNVTVYDPDNDPDNITYEWYKDSNLVATSQAWLFSTGYCDGGTYNITAIVRDFTSSDSNEWNITISDENRPAIFNDSIQNLTWREPYNITNNFTLVDYVTDPDFECNVTQISDLNFGVTGNTNISIIIDSDGNVSFYPDFGWSGTEYVQFTTNDGYNTSFSSVVRLTVSENHAPVIQNIKPYGNETFDNNTNTTILNTIFGWASTFLFPNSTKVNMSENSSMTFEQQSSDLNAEDSLSYMWLLDGTEQITTSSWTFETSFNDSGYRNVTVIVSDGFKQDSFYWNVTVANKNIAPIFGRIEHTYYLDFSSGTTNRTNLTEQQGSIVLSKQNPTDYFPSGTFISEAIDLNEDNIKPELLYISWSGYTPNSTNISSQTRVSQDGSSWSNWSEVYINSNGSTIVNYTPSDMPIQRFNNGVWYIWDNRYAQYKINFLTSNTSITPIVSDITLAYEVADFESDEDVTMTDWIDLDDYFYDPDGQSLSFTYNGTEVDNFDYINVGSDHVVGFKPKSDWSGTATIYFVASDEDNYTRSSNNITLNIIDAPDEEPLVRTITRTRTRTEPVPTKEVAYLELIVPGPLMAGPDETIIAPLTLENNGDVLLTGILLSAVSEVEGFTLEFSQNSFGQIDVGQSVDTELYITIGEEVMEGTYGIVVEAEVLEPAAKDKATIIVSLLANMTERINTVRDFLQLQPECLELNELIIQARSAMEQGRNNEAIVLLDEAVEGCKYLTSARQNIVTPSPKEFRLNVRWASITAGVWILLLILVNIISTIVRKRSMRGQPK